MEVSVRSLSGLQVGSQVELICASGSFPRWRSLLGRFLGFGYYLKLEVSAGSLSWLQVVSEVVGLLGLFMGFR